MNTAITNFAIDTENPDFNFELAQYYQDIGHTASAISHYLRCAERTTDILIEYNCLILIYLCFQEQKNRDFTAEHILKQAIAICPDRPEAYFLLCKLLLYQNKYFEAYLFSSICLDICKFNGQPISYIKIGIYSHILFIKGIAGFHWEKIEESLNILKNLYSNNYTNFNQEEKNMILSNIQQYDNSFISSDLFMSEYNDACSKNSDINYHMPYLLSLAKECSHITEFGVRHGDSTKTFLYADKILRSYDLMLDDTIQQLFDIAHKHNRNVKYIKANVLDVNIEQTDMLFIDTWHQYDQLKQELHKHAKFVNKYIVLHDTFTFGINGENSSGCGGIVLTDHLNDPIGLLPALIEFMIEYPEWKFKYHTINNNGLIVIQRISQ